MTKTGWIGVDLDGCLAKYEGWVNAGHVGEPVPKMLARVKCWLAEGIEVRIFTARVGPQKDVNEAIRAREAIDKWCLEHLGQTLEITATKDFSCFQMWDDRAVQVIPNTGVSYEELTGKACELIRELREIRPDEITVDRLAGELSSLLE
jgi:hypothetical protein